MLDIGQRIVAHRIMYVGGIGRIGYIVPSLWQTGVPHRFPVNGKIYEGHRRDAAMPLIAARHA